MIELAAGSATAIISPVDGGRIASLRIDGREVLVTGDSSSNPLHWGSYPMVPYAGRIRRGRFTFAGREHHLPISLAPHAIHGSGFTSRWEVLDAGLDHAELQTDLTWSLDMNNEDPTVSNVPAPPSAGKSCTSISTPSKSRMVFWYSRRFSRRTMIFPPESPSTRRAVTSV
jgi:galactose mutarotase-like enzyme